MKTKIAAVFGQVSRSVLKAFGLNGLAEKSEAVVMKGAVVGIVDMVGSTRISNMIDMETEFEFKRRFQQLASGRARACGIEILNHTGDGFVFLANKENGAGWQEKLLRFHCELTGDFQELLADLNHLTGHRFQSGLRFGVASGDVVLGFLSSNPAHYTAVGAVVNLAARICGVGSPDEIVFSSEAWELMRAYQGTLAKNHYEYMLKGFDDSVEAVHVNRERREVRQHEEAIAEGVLSLAA